MDENIHINIIFHFSHILPTEPHEYYTMDLQLMSKKSFNVWRRVSEKVCLRVNEEQNYGAIGIKSLRNRTFLRIGTNYALPKKIKYKSISNTMKISWTLNVNQQ